MTFRPKLHGWPASVEIETIVDSLLEAKGATFTHVGEVAGTGIENVVDVNTYSNLNRLLRVTAFVLRFISNLKKKRWGKQLEIDQVLRAEEISIAEHLLVGSA